MAGCSCLNCEMHKESAENNKKIIKRMLKALPNSTLKQYLVELNIIKEDYLTGKVSWVTRKTKKAN